MDRRLAIKNLGMFTGGMILLPSCDFSEEKASIAMNKFQITVEQKELVKDLVTVIIPEGEIPGAGSLEVDNFVWIMVDDCLEEEKQKSFLKGLEVFELQVEKNYGKSFSKLEQEERTSMLENIFIKQTDDNIDEEYEADEQVKDFVNITKNYTIWGYMKSQYIMTEIMPYQLVPGTYNNCQEIDTNKRINVNG